MEPSTGDTVTVSLGDAPPGVAAAVREAFEAGAEVRVALAGGAVVAAAPV
jgi:hypothetical protein